MSRLRLVLKRNVGYDRSSTSSTRYAVDCDRLGTTNYSSAGIAGSIGISNNVGPCRCIAAVTSAVMASGVVGRTAARAAETLADMLPITALTTRTKQQPQYRQRRDGFVRQLRASVTQASA